MLSEESQSQKVTYFGFDEKADPVTEEALRDMVSTTRHSWESWILLLLDELLIPSRLWCSHVHGGHNNIPLVWAALVIT